LIVRLRNYVGDVVLGLPSLRLLHARGYALQLFGKPWAASLLAAYPWPVVTRPPRFLHRVGSLRQMRRQALAVDPGFDRRENMLVFPNACSGALEAWFAGLHAVGNALDGRSPLLARAEAPHWAHALEHAWGLTCRFLKIDLPAPARIQLATRSEDQRRADELLRRHGVGPGFVAICPFAGGVFEDQPKTWPAFPEFARALKAAGREVVCFPGPGEAAVAAARYPEVKAIANVDLGAYTGVLRRAAMVIANDTGPGHIAAAVGAPLVSVLGPTVPEQWAPWGPTVRIVRHWPRWPTVDEVMAAAEAGPGSVPVAAVAPFSATA
jgi:heptosyltransferase-2